LTDQDGDRSIVIIEPVLAASQDWSGWAIV
jgi:hypothetical protein